MRHISLIIAVLALAIAAPAIAGKGGVPNGGGENGNGNGGGDTGGSGSYSPTLSVDLPLGLAADTSTDTPYTITGCEYDAGYGVVSVVVYTPVAVASTGANPDGSGCISVSNFDTQGAGTYRVEAWQHVKNRDVVVATTSFTY